MQRIYIYIYICKCECKKIGKGGCNVFFSLVLHVAHPNCQHPLSDLLPKSLLTFLIFLAASEVQQLLSSFFIPLSFFLFPSSPLLTRQPSLSHQSILTLSKEEIKGLRLKFQLQIVGGKKSKLYLFISTTLTSILIL